MPSAEAPCSIHQDISVQQVGAETLLYDERRHLAFCLNQSSSVLWRLANGQRSVEQLRAAASLELQAPISEEFVLFALDQLRRDGLLQPEPVPPVAPALSRRAMLQKIGVGGAILIPAIAAIVAPTAAQAYNGCVDCSLSPAIVSDQASAPIANTRAARRAQERRLQQSRTASSFNPFADQRPYVPYTPPKSTQAPTNQDTQP